MEGRNKKHVQKPCPCIYSSLDSTPTAVRLLCKGGSGPPPPPPAAANHSVCVPRRPFYRSCGVSCTGWAIKVDTFFLLATAALPHHVLLLLQRLCCPCLHTLLACKPSSLLQYVCISHTKKNQLSWSLFLFRLL